MDTALELVLKERATLKPDENYSRYFPAINEQLTHDQTRFYNDPAGKLPSYLTVRDNYLARLSLMAAMCLHEIEQIKIPRS